MTANIKDMPMPVSGHFKGYPTNTIRHNWQNDSCTRCGLRRIKTVVPTGFKTSYFYGQKFVGHRAPDCLIKE